MQFPKKSYASYMFYEYVLVLRKILSYLKCNRRVEYKILYSLLCRNHRYIILKYREFYKILFWNEFKILAFIQREYIVHCKKKRKCLTTAYWVVWNIKKTMWFSSYEYEKFRVFSKRKTRKMRYFRDLCVLNSFILTKWYNM